MYLKKTLLGFLILILITTTAGCGSTLDILKDTTPSMENLNRDVVEVYTLQEMQDLINTKIDTLVGADSYYVYDKMDAIPSEYSQQLLELINKAESCIELRKNNTNIMSNSCYNYLTWTFDFTAGYKFVNTGIDFVGWDRANKRFIIDVTYNTINTQGKQLLAIPDIVKGEPEEQLKKQIRYKRYIAKIQNKSENSWSTGGLDVYDYQQTENSTESVEQQTNVSGAGVSVPTSNYGRLLGEVTTNVVSNAVNTSNSTMKIRYIAKLSDVTLDTSIESAYLIEYNTGTNLQTEGSNQATANVLLDFINRFTLCLNDQNYQGLYKLMDNSGRYESQFARMYDCTYNSFTSKVEQIIERKGEIIKLLVKTEINRKAKNLATSYAVYLEEAVWTLKWTPDIFKVVDIEPVSIKLKKEPAILIANEYKIILDSIKGTDVIDETVKVEITNALRVISKAQINNGNVSKYFDNTKSVKNLSILEREFKGLGEQQKRYTYITEWVYASDISCYVKLREYIITDKGYYEVLSTIKLNKTIPTDETSGWAVTEYYKNFITTYDKSEVKSDDYYVGCVEQ